uniref:Myosin IXB n=1 Tax=Callorhinchus milii TaxID=7868 RepID=A0A4W3HQY2_CALMI
MSIKDAGDAGNQKDKVYKLQVCPSLWSENSVCCQIPATIEVTAGDVIHQVAGRLNLDLSKRYVLAEVKEPGGEEWILDPNDSPVQRIKLWPRKAQEDHDQSEGYYFLLQERNTDGSIRYINLQLVAKEREQRRLVERGFLPPQQQLYDDLCNLPLLAEKTILENLKNRFLKQKIYTYAGSILIAINPFKFLPIYNPKYVKMYENHQLGKLEPHIFAIADVAYHTMLRKQINQCIVISGESGSGKTQSTNFLIHCLTALSQKGYASGVERTILGAGPVLEAFGNAKTAHNNNSSLRARDLSRNYHVFYYLLMGATKEERREFHLQQPENYYYLNQLNFCIDDGEDLKHDFERLKQAMEMVGFLHATKKQIFLVLSAILYLGNVTYKKKATGRDEGLEIGPPEVLETLSQLLKVKQEMLVEALTKRKTVTVGEKLILSYSLNEAITARDSMAKSLYSALFDWIVLRINHALLNKKDLEESVTCLSIGVLDIFGFEDFENNSFEQFCINYANEQLQYYFNQHIFKLEQEEYQSEGITWHNIDYTDNVGCIHLISRKPTGLFHLLDEESNFPHATNQTLLAKFKQQHEDNRYFVGTPVMEPAFVIQHFAGKVKYQIKDFREKNTDYMRPDIVALLRSSDSAFIRELIGMDPVSVFRWAILRATIRATAAFWDAGRREAQNHAGVMRRKPRVPLGELQRANTPAEKNLMDSSSLKHIVRMTLYDRTTKSLLHLHKKKKPPSISAQFQASLNKLMETLGKAEPFFIRCIRSNAKKSELCLDDELVLQQLKYTGMLETVRIRRSGYSAKYTFQEFVNQFQVLLPKNPKPAQEAISTLFHKMGLNRENCQIGKTKVFMKETERQKLQDTLHKEVMRKIILLQGWFRAVLEKRRFVKMRQAAITIQVCVGWGFCPINVLSSLLLLLTVGWEFWKGQIKWGKGVSSIQTCFLSGRFLNRVSFCALIDSLRLKSEEEQRAREKARQEDEEREAQTRKTAAASHKPERSTVEGESEAVFRSLAAESSEPEPPWLGSELTPGLMENGESQEQLSKSQENTSGAQGTERTSASREKRENRRIRGLEHEKFQRRLVSPNPEETTSHFPPPPLPSGTREQEVKTIDIVEKMAQNANKVGAVEPGKPEAGAGVVSTNEFLQEKEMASSRKIPKGFVNELRRMDEEVANQKRNHQPPSQSLRPTSLPLKTSPCPGQVTLTRSFSQSSDQEEVEQRPDSPGAHQGAIHRYNDKGELRNKAEKWKDRRQAETVTPTMPKKEAIVVRKESQVVTGCESLTWFILLSGGEWGACSTLPRHTPPDHGGKEQSTKVKRSRSIKISNATTVSEQWDASVHQEITNSNELKHLDEFLMNKVNDLNSRSSHESRIETLFITTTDKFRMTLKSMYSNSQTHMGYKGLMQNYQLLLTSLAEERQKAEIQLVLNLFQSLLDEFARSYAKKEEAEALKLRKREENGTKYYQVNILQSCELCSSYIWTMERALLCSCNMTCHKKCLPKIQYPCSSTFSPSQNNPNATSQHFGVSVCDLTNEQQLVPLLMEILLEYVEMHGLYTEGIYRKSGAANKMKELRQKLEADPTSVILENYHIHAITGLLKQWLRELPEPLMTYALYSDFLRAIEHPERQEQLVATYNMLEQLPPANHSTLERLIFHLVKVAVVEDTNRMSTNALAIVFAPCILLSPDTSDPLMSMRDVSKTTMCVELLISEQLRKYRMKMDEIAHLETAEHIAVRRLSLLRVSQTPYLTLPRTPKVVEETIATTLESLTEESSDTDTEREQEILIERIQSIKEERDELTLRLPELEQRGSDEENMDSEASLSMESLIDERLAQAGSGGQ